MLNAYNIFQVSRGAFSRDLGYTTFPAQWVRETAWQDKIAVEDFIENLRKLLTDAGYPLPNDNSYLIYDTLIQLIKERDMLREIHKTT